ncbi:MAG: autotransporter domain-containing protein [Pseudomonadota bacterium]
MKNSPAKSSAKSLRVFGGVSTIALSVGMAPLALAQEAPAPTPTPVPVPSPMVPTAPENAADCVFDGTATPSTLICGPGTDADGFSQAEDGVDVTVEAGAQVQGEINLNDMVDATIDGDIVVTDGGSALDFGDNATVINNGFLTGNPALDGIISVDAEANVTNNNTGIITSTGNLAVAGINVGSDSTVVNDGLIALTGDGNIGVLGGSMIDSTGVSITNTANGQILVDGGELGLAFAIAADDETTVTNDGLLQVEGDTSAAIFVGDDSTVTNTGDILVSGEESVGIVGGENLTVDNSGFIIATGDDTRAIEAEDGLTLTNSGTIEATDRAINAGDDVTITNEMGGLINTTGDADTIQTGDNTTIINNGTISNEGFDTKIIDAGDGLTVTNNGTITSDWKGVEGVEDFTLTNNAGAQIISNMDEAIEADGPGLVVVNDGDIIAPMDDAVDGGADVTITNTGLIQGGENDGLELDSGTITNSGIIESLSSDPDGDFSDAGLTNRELDAGIDFDGVDDPDTLAGPETDTVTNLEGGIIRGDIGINASSGNFVEAGEGGEGASEPGSPANVRSQTVANFGEITANAINPVTERMDAVLLGAGADEFQQWTGAVVNGWVDLEAGDDTFILEGTSSSITGSVVGGEGNDTAILAGVLDSDNITGFETIQLGSTLGGTLNDLVISGDRIVTGDVVHVGEVTVGLGVDSLTTTGSITLEEGGVLTIETPLDEELAGQTVLVFDDGTGFTNNGATVNIIDDDLLLDYTVIIDSLSVQVDLVNPLNSANIADPNINIVNNAVNAALAGGTLTSGSFDILNSQADAEAYSDALKDTLPSLSDGVGREIFETGSLAGRMLDHHLDGDEPGAWGQIAVRGVNQDAISQSVDGYDSNQVVITVGSDLSLGEGILFGLMASYADIDVQDETATGAITNDQDIESLRLGGYLAINLFERGFLNTEISYLTGEVDTARSGEFGNITSSYDFDGVATRIVAGYDLLPDENITLTPSVGFNAALINFDDAQEAGGFDFLVEQGDARFIEARAGVELGAQMSDKVSGFVQGIVIHDLIDSERSLVLSSGELRTFAISQPVREQDRFELSAGLVIDVSDNFAIDLGYLGDFNDGYTGHSARANVRVAF